MSTETTSWIDLRDFWPMYGTDPVVDAILRTHHWRTAELPRTALEFLDCLRQIGYSIGELEDLHLEHPHGHRGVEGFRGDSGEVAAGGVDEGADSGLDAQGALDGRRHESSSRCDEGADTPVDRTVEVAPDKGAGTGRDPLGPAGPHASGVSR